MSIYYCRTLKDQKTQIEYKVRLLKNKESVINFKTFKNSLQIDFNIWLDGDFNLPPNLLLIQLTSSIGNVKNISLDEVYTNGNEHNFIGHCNISFANTDLNKNLHFLEKLNFNSYLSINVDAYNSAKLDDSFDDFMKNINSIRFNNEIMFSNYFPINKLSSFYVSNQYKHSTSQFKQIPHDYFNWETSNLTTFPDYYFDPMKNQESNKPIVNLYKSNIGKGDISYLFDYAKITIKYLIDKEWKVSNFELINSSNNENKDSDWVSLNLKTYYDFKKKELIQTNEGVKGIYFPIPTEGYVQLNLYKNDQLYKDEIKFNFTNNLYSSINKDLCIQIIDSKQDIKDNQWTRLTYA